MLSWTVLEEIAFHLKYFCNISHRRKNLVCLRNVNKIHIKKKEEKLKVWNCLEINYISLRPKVGKVWNKYLRLGICWTVIRAHWNHNDKDGNISVLICWQRNHKIYSYRRNCSLWRSRGRAVKMRGNRKLCQRCQIYAYAYVDYNA